MRCFFFFFFFSSRRRHTRLQGDWSSDVCSSDLRADLVGDPRFEGAPWGIAAEHRQPLKDLIESIIRTRPRDEWLSILREADVPCAPVMSRLEFINHPQTRALEMRREIDDPTLGPTLQMGQPVFLNDTPGEIAGPAPKAGDDRVARQWLAEPV